VPKVPTLRDLRNGKGRAIPPPPLTQDQVAELANLSQSMITAIETGRRKPSPRALWRLAQVYGVTYEFIVLAAEETARRGSDG
jgi:transcriptional regulator with XRE-family HTH domain